MGMLRCCRVATQANTSVGLKDGIFMFLLYKTIYICFMFSDYAVYTVFIKEH